MSILIKNMTKPNDCYDCFFSDDELGCFFFTHDCPLVGIPTPHGRLIDADKLIEELKECADAANSNWEYEKATGYSNSIESVEEALTIIEAEGSEE